MSSMEDPDVKHDQETAIDAHFIHLKIANIRKIWHSNSSEWLRDYSKELFDLLEMRGKKIKCDEEDCYYIALQLFGLESVLHLNNSERDLKLYILLVEWAIDDLCLNVTDAERTLDLMVNCHGTLGVIFHKISFLKEHPCNFYLIITRRIISLLERVQGHIMQVSVQPSLNSCKGVIAGSNLLLISECCNGVSDLGKALKFAKRGIALMTELRRDDENRIRIFGLLHYEIGNVYLRVEDYIAAAGAFTAAIKIFKEALNFPDKFKSRWICKFNDSLRKAQISQYCNPQIL